MYSHYRATLGNRGEQVNRSWNDYLLQYADRFQEDHQELLRRINGTLPTDWDRLLPVYGENDPAVGGRKYSEIILNHLCSSMPELLGGSADLSSSNYTRAKTAEDFQAPETGLGSYSGSYVRYGVREHAMGAIMNGLSAYGCFIPFAGTFLNFVSGHGDPLRDNAERSSLNGDKVSYSAGAIRLSALSGHQVIWVATHE